MIAVAPGFWLVFISGIMAFVNSIMLIGSVQGFFLTFLILYKKKILFHRLFAFVLLCISCALLLAYLQNVLDLKSYPFLIKTNLPLPLVFIPALLIYLKKLADFDSVNRTILFLLFAPFFVLVIYNIPFYLGSNEIKWGYFLRNELSGTPLFIEQLEEVFIEFFVALYGFIGILETRKYKRRVELVYANQSKAQIGWVKLLAYSMFVMTFFAFVLSVAGLFTDKVPFELNFLTAIGSTVAIYSIAYYLLIHPDALSEVSLALQSVSSKLEAGKETNEEKSDLLFQEFERKIIHLLGHEKLYSNPDITLSDLAERVGLPPYLTSKILNQKLNSNFYSFINKYRLQQVKDELLRNSGKSIIEIAYDAGFNSKTTFYESFKKDTGVSPSEFIRLNRPA